MVARGKSSVAALTAQSGSFDSNSTKPRLCPCLRRECAFPESGLGPTASATERSAGPVRVLRQQVGLCALDVEGWRFEVNSHHTSAP